MKSMTSLMSAVLRRRFIVGLWKRVSSGAAEDEEVKEEDVAVLLVAVVVNWERERRWMR